MEAVDFYRGHQVSGLAETRAARAYNNAVVASAIESFAPADVDDVLDLACGRGGAVHKLRHLHPRSVTFVDASEPSVSECHRRSEKVGLVGRFHVSDLRLPFDFGPHGFVYCGFALHYFYPNLDTFLGSLRRCCRPWATVLVTVPDDSRVRPVDSSLLRIDSITSESYRFTLKGSVEAVTEFRMPLPLLVQRFADFGFGLVHSVGFADAKVRKVRMPDSQDARQVCEFYRVVVFRFTVPPGLAT